MRDFFAPFGRWPGLAAGYALRAAGSRRRGGLRAATAFAGGGRATPPPSARRPGPASSSFVEASVIAFGLVEQVVGHPGARRRSTARALLPAPDLGAGREEVGHRAPSARRLELLLRRRARGPRRSGWRPPASGSLRAARSRGRRPGRSAGQRRVVDDRVLADDEHEPVVGRNAGRARAAAGACRATALDPARQIVVLRRRRAVRQRRRDVRRSPSSSTSPWSRGRRLGVVVVVVPCRCRCRPPPDVPRLGDRDRDRRSGRVHDRADAAPPARSRCGAAARSGSEEIATWTWPVWTIGSGSWPGAGITMLHVRGRSA